MKPTCLNIFILLKLLLTIFLIEAKKFEARDIVIEMEARGIILSLEKLNPCERAVWR